MSLKHRGTGIESRATNILFFVLWLQIIWDGLVKYIVMRGSISCEPSMWNAYCIVRLKRDGTRTETRFRLSAKRTSPFKSAGASVSSTAGSRGVRISGSNAGYTTFWGSVRVLTTHSIRQFPLHFPSHASPCAIRFQKHSTVLIRLVFKNMNRNDILLGIYLTEQACVTWELRTYKGYCLLRFDAVLSGIIVLAFRRNTPPPSSG